MLLPNELAVDLSISSCIINVPIKALVEEDFDECRRLHRHSGY